MSLSFLLFVAALAGLIVFLYLRVGKKKRGKDSGRNDTGGGGDSVDFDSGSQCGDSSSGGCGGGDGGGGGD